MKTLAKLANLGSLALVFALSHSAFAESAVGEAPALTLAFNSGTVTTSWNAPAMKIEEKALANNVEIDLSKSMEKISEKLNKQLEDKLAKDLEYAMQ